MKPYPTGSRTGRRPLSPADNPAWPGASAEAIRRATHYIRIEDIAHALANACCIQGQTKAFYSVAQHNYLASMLVPPQDALAALLLHTDETLERLLPEYLEIEGHSAAEVLARFGAPATPPLSVECADLVLRATEQRDLGPSSDATKNESAGVPPLTLKIQPLPPIVAKHLFLDRYYELRPEADAERLRHMEAKRRAAK
ncbi:hypothetical protein [Azoarcus olearius]|uniref:Uncharacterized protein n=1 Tax=Azoarcus sp. (strain BH72) TaxID=418699 RepID=A1K760_AZOSB|nr:hypothetical protein [Azoarcus olearius]CAL94665.1 conserved hypothetical protein [Azoarcus olearius]